MIRSSLLPSTLAGLLALSLAACSKTPTPPVTDAGPPPVDTCNTADTAKDDPTCQLALDGDPVKGFIYPAGDRDWYHLKLPAALPARPLLNVHTGYSAPSSPVTLTANIIGTDGQTSLGTGEDPRLHGEPTVFDVVVRLDAAAAGSDYYVLMQDDASDNDDPAHGDFDRKNGYTLTASVSSDPDVHEPNDTEATATGLSVGEASQASIDGALATTGDEDYYLLDVATTASRPILYIDLTAPALTPAPLTRVSFVLYPQGDKLHPIAQGSSKSPVGKQEVATARLLPGGGKYVLVVKGNKERDTDPPPAGDIRLVYTLKSQVFPDLDSNEPNDDITRSTGAVLAIGDTKIFQGRIAYVPDADWYAIDVAGSTQNSRLAYTVSFPSGGDPGRFPATDATEIHSKILNVVTTPSSLSDCITNCPGDPQIKADYCGRSISQCARSVRYENTMFSNLENFLGVVPVPARPGLARYYINIQPRSLDAANDQLYELKVQILPETPDELSAYRDSPAGAATLGMPWLSTYNPDPGTGLTVSGQISYGLLPRSDSTPADNNPLLPKAPPDYDAKNDADLYELVLPPADPLPRRGLGRRVAVVCVEGGTGQHALQRRVAQLLLLRQGRQPKLRGDRQVARGAAGLQGRSAARLAGRRGAADLRLRPRAGRLRGPPRAVLLHGEALRPRREGLPAGGRRGPHQLRRRHVQRARRGRAVPAELPGHHRHARGLRHAVQALLGLQRRL